MLEPIEVSGAEGILPKARRGLLVSLEKHLRAFTFWSGTLQWGRLPYKGAESGQNQHPRQGDARVSAIR
jgi:hypothetical protein